jgi:hypothetical protein
MCEHWVFYRRINKRYLRPEAGIHWHAFKPRHDEDGVDNGPSVYWAELRCPTQALDGHCESDGRHLIAFRECSIHTPVTIEPRDPDDPSHFYILGFPQDPEKLTMWAIQMAKESSQKIECNDKQIKNIRDDPPVRCSEVPIGD